MIDGWSKTWVNLNYFTHAPHYQLPSLHAEVCQPIQQVWQCYPHLISRWASPAEIHPAEMHHAFLTFLRLIWLWLYTPIVWQCTTICRDYSLQHLQAVSSRGPKVVERTSDMRSYTQNEPLIHWVMYAQQISHSRTMIGWYCLVYRCMPRHPVYDGALIT